jgi:hypothetical protein
MAHPADSIVGAARVDIEPAHANQSPVDPRGEQRFAGSVEAIRARCPLVDEPTDEPRSGLLALGHEGGHVVHQQVVQALDHRRHPDSPRSSPPGDYS